MNTVDIKPVVDATTDLVRKTVQTMTDTNTRVLKDFTAFSDTMIKAQTDMMKSVPSNVFADLYTNVTKMQADALKQATAWSEKFHSTK
jgi:predicted nucleotide-binding protein (sugar kinase/HSP70/actin superfamily)